jgi:hypothetical protein
MGASSPPGDPSSTAEGSAAGGVSRYYKVDSTFNQINWDSSFVILHFFFLLSFFVYCVLILIRLARRPFLESSSLAL